MPTLQRTLLRKAADRRGNGSSSSNCTRVADLLSLLTMTCTVDSWPTMGCLIKNENNMSLSTATFTVFVTVGSGTSKGMLKELEHVYSPLEFRSLSKHFLGENRASGCRGLSFCSLFNAAKDFVVERFRASPPCGLLRCARCPYVIFLYDVLPNRVPPSGGAICNHLQQVFLELCGSHGLIFGIQSTSCSLRAQLQIGFMVRPALPDDVCFDLSA